MVRRISFVALILSAVFVWLYASFYWQTAPMYNSPDENAVAVFVRHFVEQGNLTIDRPDLNEVVHPRSVNIREGQFVPGSFIGWILLLGYAAEVFGGWIVPVLPALIAVCGALAFWGIVRRIFDEQTAWLSFLGLLTLPVWWYYASRGFLPNVAFVSFLLIAAHALLRVRDNKKTTLAWAGLAGLSVGFSLAIRPNEIIWIALAGLLLLPAARKIRPSAWLACAAAVFIPLAITAYWQEQTFGHWYSTGYQSFAAGENAPDASVSAASALFPFGIDLIAALTRFAGYQVSTMIWFLIGAVAGIVVWLKLSFKTPEQKKYTHLFLLITLYLVLYYGSWNIADHPDATRLTIGVSYGRYWLPVYVMAIPFFVMGLRWLAQWLPWPGIRYGFLLALIFTLNTLAVYAFGDEHLGQLRRNIVEYREWKTFVQEQTPDNSVIISERNDKVFWPQRQVINYQPGDYLFLPEAADVARHVPVYLFTAIPRDHMAVIEQAEYIPRGLSLQYQSPYENMSLYQIIPYQP